MRSRYRALFWSWIGLTVAALVGAPGCGEESAPPADTSFQPAGGAPPGYLRGGLAFDSDRNRLVHFGGYHPLAGGQDLQAYGATWEWNGERWIGVADSGPSPRYAVAMAYDPERHVTVMYGGHGACGDGGLVCCDDTWTWDGVSWKQVSGASPGARRGALLAWDSSRRELVLVGGTSCDEPPLPNRTMWRFDGTTWREVGS